MMKILVVGYYFHLEYFLTLDHIGLEISKRYSCTFNLMTPKLHDIGYHRGIKAITFLGNRPSFKLLWHSEIVTYGNQMGKSLKCAISSEWLAVE